MSLKNGQKMKRPLFQKKKNSAWIFGGIINKHSDLFRFLDCPIPSLEIIIIFFIFFIALSPCFSAQTRT